jgi:xanthine dehydrogenase accessory factor
MGHKRHAAVLVRGSGDVGSAVAVVLVRAGYWVVLHDEPAPAATRRGMAFADAIFDGLAKLENVCARAIASVAELDRVLAAGEVPIAICPFEKLLRAMTWHAVVDARMRKRAVPELQRGIAPLTIGLGTNFIAGGNVDLAIETSWGDQLGAVVHTGPTLPLKGEPQPIGGVARGRYVYAPVAGRFDTPYRIGDRVEQGTVMATIGGTSLRAPLAGVIRGLTHDGVIVAERAKVLEIDPRGDPTAVFGLGVRPKLIAEGVLSALTEVQMSAVV